MPPSDPGVTGFDHQFSGSVWTVFWFTIEPVLPCSDHAVRHQPQALARVIFTVFASGAVSPFICRLGSLAASLSSIVLRKLVVPALLLLEGGAPAAFFTALKPSIALRFEAYAPCKATARLKE